MNPTNSMHDANPLGREPTGDLLRKFTIPSIIAMLVSSLYNIVDQFFIGQAVGPQGNAATNIAFPLSTSCLESAVHQASISPWVKGARMKRSTIWAMLLPCSFAVVWLCVFSHRFFWIPSSASLDLPTMS